MIPTQYFPVAYYILCQNCIFVHIMLFLLIRPYNVIPILVHETIAYTIPFNKTLIFITIHVYIFYHIYYNDIILVHIIMLNKYKLHNIKRNYIVQCSIL